MTAILSYICIIIFCYFILLWTGSILLLIMSLYAVICKYQEAKYNNQLQALNTYSALPITIIIPAYNERHRIEHAISALFKSTYKNIHLTVVNDGSIDDMLNFLIETYSLIPIPTPQLTASFPTGKIYTYYQSRLNEHFIVIDKEHSPFANSGADCINAGLNICNTPLFLTVDADTLLEPDTLSHLLFTYLTNPHCLAIGADIYVPDPKQIQAGTIAATTIPTNPVLGVQVCEYLRSFLYGREGWTFLGGALCHPGGCTMLETQAVLEVGGYDAANYSYDAEIIIKLHHKMRKQKYPYAIIYAPSAIAWAAQPATIKGLWNQRAHWQRGLLRSLSLHKSMIFNPRYGRVGLIGWPYYILFEIFGPVVEGLSYLTFIFAYFFMAISLSQIAWLLLLAWSFMLAITMACVLLSLITYNKYYRYGDILRMIGFTLLDFMFYRQMRAFCAIIGSLHYYLNRLRGKAQ